MSFALNAAALLVLSLGLAGCANSLFYYPERKHYENPDLKRLAPEDVWFQSKDGTKLHGWFLKAQGEPKATIVHFHGNAQNISTHTSYVSWLPRHGYNVLVFDYRGYGQSEGKPGREGVYQDSLAAVRYAQSRSDVDKNKLILFGQSLGGAQAVGVAGSGEFPQLRAVIEESGFSSYSRIGREKMLDIPLLGYVLWVFSPVLVTGAHNPDGVVGKIAPIPLLVIHGRQDPVVPYHHANILFEKAGNPKLQWTVEQGGHTDTFSRFGRNAQPRLLKFLDYALSRNPADLDPADQSAAGLRESGVKGS